MIIESDIKDISQSDFGSQYQDFNDLVSKILSTEVPKTKVIVRKRPLNQKEISCKEVDNISMSDKTKVVVSELKKNLDLTKYIDKKEFMFDRVFDEKSSNDTIYKEEIRPMIYNAFYQKAKITCFAYGQTGSGKTYTLIGNTNSNFSNKNSVPGLYALAGYDIFLIKDSDKTFKTCEIFVSFYEIYCNKLYDLLNNRNILETREDYKHDINVIGLSENKVNSLEDLMKVINFGARQRTIGKTGANSESSRSHGIIQIRIYDSENQAEHAKISFIDLAGSERESDKVNVDKKTRIDGAAINQSLLALKECIRALEENKIHLPFRGSKLTLVLRDSFIGNCKTLMISTISPGYKTTEQTLNTLRYAYRLKEIKTVGNTAKNLKGNNTKNLSKNNNNIFKSDPNQYISNLLSNNNNLNFFSNNNKTKNNINDNKNKKNGRKISSDSKNNKNEIDLFSKLDKKPRKRKKSYSSSNSSMKDVNRKNSNSNKKVKKEMKVKSKNTISQFDDIFNLNKQNSSKNQPENNNNICTLTLMTSNNDNSTNNIFNGFNKNNQMNFTQQINLHNTNIDNLGNNNNNNPNFSFNLLNENNNVLNLSSNSLLSFQSNTFNNMNLQELEKKNEKMVEDIVNQEKIVTKNQQLHINSMCELIKTEINTFQQYQQEQLDISAYIEAMKNILKSQQNQFTDINNQLEKLNYMINQQIKLSNLIEQMKQSENCNLNKSNNSNNSFMEDQNTINLKNLQNIQSQINNLEGRNAFS